MAVEYRGARAAELPAVREVIAATWDDPEDEPALWDFLLESDASLTPENVRVAVVDGKVVAATTLLRRRVRGPWGWVEGAEMTLVACHPDHRGQGYGGGTVRDALGHLAATGGSLCVFYGEPAFYPRFGCVPVFPTLRTQLPAAAATDSAARLRLAEPHDMPRIVQLYDEQVSAYPGAVARSGGSWVWRVRNPATHALLVSVGGDSLFGDPGATEGYALVAFGGEADRLLVREAAATSPAAARNLLAGLRAEAAGRRRAEVHLHLPPDNLLVRMALLAGAQQHYWPAQTGFVAVTDWQALLPPGYRVSEDRGPVGPVSGPAALFYRGQLLLEADRQILTQLVMSYRGIDDLLLLMEERSTELARFAHSVEEVVLERIRDDFPPGFPKYSEGPYFFWH